MKKDTLQQHKEFALLYDEVIFEPKTHNFMSIPHITKIGVVVVRNPIVAKPNVNCINCHHINHNVETCKFF